MASLDRHDNLMGGWGWKRESQSWARSAPAGPTSIPANVAFVFRHEFLRVKRASSVVDGQKVNILLSNPVDQSIFI